LRQSGLDLETDGATILRGAVAFPFVEAVLAGHQTGGAGRRQFALMPAMRAVVAGDGPMATIARRYVGDAARPVRAIIFDKTPGANWALGWHQDRTVALAARADVEGFANWNIKDGVPHAEPPASLLAGMLTLRLFLDDCDEGNGPLEIALGTHRLGRVPHGEVAAAAERAERFAATGLAGDLLVMRLLTIHASGRAARPTHRRVLHVDYCAEALPISLEWALAS
jgi:hypothetical protein